MTASSLAFARALRAAALVAGAALAVAGCAGVPKTAVVDGQTVPRLNLELTGQPYTLHHEGAHPRPGGPSDGLKDAGGSLTGRICGMFVDFDVRHAGDHIDLVGSLDNSISAAIAVRDHGGMRQVTGNLGGNGVDFEYNATDVRGHVGIRVFALEADGDLWRGQMRIPGLLGSGMIPVTINGRSVLASLSAADQAAVFPALMTCNPGGAQFTMIEGLVVGVGGKATDRPPETSSVYTKR